MTLEQLVAVDPRTPIPGALVVIAPVSQLDALRTIETERTPRRYKARAVLGEQIPLAGGIHGVLATVSPKLVQLTENPTTLYIHQGGARAVFYDLCASAEGFLSHVDVEVEATLPSNVFLPARSAINNLLDTLIGSAWIPLTIIRMELRLQNSDAILAYQLVMPFPGALRVHLLGGMDSVPLFDPYEALIREAINSQSPFYRFLCAHRLYEGINDLRRSLAGLREKLNVAEKLPGDVKIDLEALGQLGFTSEFLQGVRTLGDLHGKLNDARNRIAHFLFKGDAFAVNTSNGFSFADYSLVGAVLVQYAHQSLVDLRRYHALNLHDHTRHGEILPLVEDRGRFIVRAG